MILPLPSRKIQMVVPVQTCIEFEPVLVFVEFVRRGYRLLD